MTSTTSTTTDAGAEPVDWGAVRLPGLGSDTVALVTGASGSIGRATTEALTSLGVRVGAVSRSEGLLADLARSAGPELIEPIVADVAEEGQGVAAVDTVVSRWGRLDVLIHLAAVADSKAPISDVSVEEWDRIFAINVRGTMLMARAAAAPMRRQGNGRIVTVASVAASRTKPGDAAYPASKAAVLRLTRQLAVDLGPDGIIVNCVSPGQTPGLLRSVDEQPGAPSEATASRRRDNRRIAVGRRGVLDDYVGPILFFCSSLSQYVTGAELLADGGVNLRR